MYRYEYVPIYSSLMYVYVSFSITNLTNYNNALKSLSTIESDLAVLLHR